MNSKKIFFALLILPFVFSSEINSQNFRVSPLIDMPGDNLEFDILSPDFFEIPNGEAYICWINKIDTVYTVYLKQLAPILSDNIIISSDLKIKSNPQIAINRYDQGIKIVWQCYENNTWQVYLKNYISNQLSDSSLILDALDTDPQISLSIHRLAWIENGNLFFKEFYPGLSENILVDSLNCLSPELLKYDILQGTEILYEKDYTDSVKVILASYNESWNPKFEYSCLSNGLFSKNPKFGLDRNIAFQTFENGIWKSEYSEYYWWEPKITQNTDCNYYNPILFTYPIPISSPYDYTPFFLAFDTDSLVGNNEIFIKTFFYDDEDSLLNISQSEGNDYRPQVAYILDSDSVMVSIIWLHNENNKTDIWIAKNRFNPMPGDVDDKYSNNFSFILSQNYPNPFNPSTTIEYFINTPGKVKIVVYDFLGREVKTIVNAFKSAGSYQEVFNADNLSSGIYFYRLFNENKFQTKSMILLK